MVEVNTDESVQKFDFVKKYFLDCLELNSLDVEKACDKFANADETTKIAIEHSFRTYVVQNLTKMTITDMHAILNLSVSAAQKKLCLPTTPIHLLNDMLSTLTIEKCSEIFCYLEESSHIWKSEMFYSSVKNYLLRMCNDLLKRLSKSQNTVFSGRIHLFLAKLFPLAEKSGLNLMSHFSDNFTRYTNNPEAFEEAINKNKSDLMETDDTNDFSTHSMPIDYNLYLKFWSLQDVFCRPNTCYDKLTWKLFTSNAGDVLEALKGYKLEDLKDESGRKMDEYDDMNLYFSKYLTSEKLLDLQLNDSNFRRQILLQFVILFQYLTAEVKFKSSSQVLSDEQLSWIKSSNRKVTELLKETPSQGSKFCSGVKHILEREEIWNKWKNESCPNFVKEKKSQTHTKTASKRPRPVSSDFLLKSSTNKVFLADSSLMSKLCNVNHENLEVCRDNNRQFLPLLKEFFQDAIEQLDPANQVEKQYFLINQTDWAWKGLRLLAKRSPYYFMQNQNVKTISEYLEAICGKLNKDFNAEQQAEVQNSKNEVEKGEKDASPIDENEDTQGNDEEFDDDQARSIRNENDEEMASEEKNEIDEEPESCKENFIDCELINFIVENIGDEDQLKKLVNNLTKLVSDKIDFENNDDMQVKYKKILQTWTEVDERADLLNVLVNELKELDRHDLAAKVESRLK